MTEASARKGDWMQTYTGRQFWPLDPRPDDVDIRDIARSLSMMCRYAGHVRKFYSVAEHCCHIFDAVADLDDEVRLWALLHDASEAYLVDVPRPVKPHLTNYREIEDAVMQSVAQRFGLMSPMPGVIKDLDRRILADERAQIVGATAHEWCDCGPALDITIHGWAPAQAESEFLRRMDACASAVKVRVAGLADTVHSAFVNGTSVLRSDADASAADIAQIRDGLKSVAAEIEQAFRVPAESLGMEVSGASKELGVIKLEPLFASVIERVLSAAGVEDHAQGHDTAAVALGATTAAQPPHDYFETLVKQARFAAETAMRKYPQPNYVALKIAEESGEVVRGAVHYAEGRMTWEEVEGEIVQLLAMLIRFVSEGDQVLGAVPPSAKTEARS